MKAEHQRRQSNRDDVAEYFKAHASEWVPASALAAVGGILAWRTRVSDCRRQLGMFIENKLEHVDEPGGTFYVLSSYRYLPHEPIGPPADEYREVTLFNLSDRQERR
jgi:hypothetical protein